MFSPISAVEPLGECGKLILTVNDTYRIAHCSVLHESTYCIVDNEIRVKLEKMTTPSNSSNFGSRELEDLTILSPNSATNTVNNNQNNVNRQSNSLIIGADGDAIVNSSASGRSSRSNRSLQRSYQHVTPPQNYQRQHHGTLGDAMSSVQSLTNRQ